MIKFNCEHCNNRLVLDKQYAGRDGWCRVCKQMVVVPGKGVARLADLPPEEQQVRMRHLLRYAAGKADHYKLLLSRALVSPNAGAVSEAPETGLADAAVQAELDLARTALDGAESRLAQSEAEVARMRAAQDRADESAETGRAEFARLDEEMKELQDALERESRARAEAEDDLEVVQKSAMRLVDQLAEPRNKLKELSKRACEAEKRESELASALQALDASAITALDKTKAEVVRGEAELAEARDALSEVRNALSEARRGREMGEAECKRLAALFEETLSRGAGAELAAADSQEEIARLEAALAEATAVHAAAASGGREAAAAAALRQERDEAQTAFEEARRARTRVEADLERNAEELARAHARIEELLEAMALLETAEQAGPRNEVALLGPEAEQIAIQDEREQMMKNFLRFLDTA